MGYRYTALLMGGGATPSQKSTTTRKKKEPSSSADMSKKKKNDPPKKKKSLGSSLASPITTSNATITKSPVSKSTDAPKKRKSKDDASKKRKPKDNATNVDKKRKLEPMPAATKTSVRKPHPPLPTPNTATTKVFKRRLPLPLLNESYQLTRVLKGHATDTDGSNNTPANLWACEFEPEKNVVAIGGSNNILFLDVQLGRYVKKYTHIEQNEEFLCLAWTTLKGPKDLLDENAPENASCNILAAAGVLGSIKLFNTLQNECYRYLFGHQKQVRKLQFAKSKPRWLFSASDDLSVRLWDVGAPNTDNTENAATCLARFPLPTSEPSALSIAPDLSFVMVGCVQGELARFDMRPKDIRDLEKNDGHTKSIKHKSIFSSGDEWHEGYVDDICVLGQQKQEDGVAHHHALDGCIVSRGSDDYETLIWRPKTSTKNDADIAISLEWPDSTDHAGLRFKVVEKYGDKVLVAGDYEGQIRIFNIGDGRSSRTLADGTKEMFPPTKVLSHAMSSGLVRDLCISDDTKKIIAVDSVNNVFVWIGNGK